MKNDDAVRPDQLTRFQAGNEFWKARSSHGRKPIFETPEALESACDEYFQWVNDNPLMSVELVKFQGEAKQVQVPKMRAMTRKALCVFLGINEQTWTNYTEKAEFLGITERIESIIFTQKFEGAAADLLNANIVSRELGLADKQTVESQDIIPTLVSKPAWLDD